jgi:acetyl esterase/lipase
MRGVWRASFSSTADEQQFKALSVTVGQRTREIAEFSVLAMEDGRQAVRVVRQRADELGIRPDRIGILGFSAGGMVAAASAMSSDPACRPRFAAVIYGGPQQVVEPARDGPALFIAYANDDDVVRNAGFDLFSAWKEAGLPCEMHVYSRGGHGFGMSPQGLASDAWIDQFGSWLTSEGLA